jgi:hypothetical protein
MAAQLVTLDTLTASYGLPRYVAADGSQVILTEITGWFGAAGRRTAHTERATADGALRSAAYRDTRVIELAGMLLPPDEMTGYEAADRLVAICPEPGERYPLAVGAPHRTLVAYVEQTGPILCERHGGALLWDWSVPLVASDPYRYSEAWVSVTQAAGAVGTGGIDTVTSGGITSSGSGIATGTAADPAAVTAAGLGSLGSAIVLEITGPTSGVQIADTSSTSVLTVAGVLADDDSIFINCSAGVAYDVPGALIPIPPYGAVLGSGSARSAVAVTGGWPTLPSGASHLFLMTGAMSAGAALSVHTRGIWA